MAQHSGSGKECRVSVVGLPLRLIGPTGVWPLFSTNHDDVTSAPQFGLSAGCMLSMVCQKAWNDNTVVKFLTPYLLLQRKPYIYFKVWFQQQEVTICGNPGTPCIGDTRSANTLVTNVTADFEGNFLTWLQTRLNHRLNSTADSIIRTANHSDWGYISDGWPLYLLYLQ